MHCSERTLSQARLIRPPSRRSVLSELSVPVPQTIDKILIRAVTTFRRTATEQLLNVPVPQLIDVRHLEQGFREQVRQTSVEVVTESPEVLTSLQIPRT